MYSFKEFIKSPIVEQLEDEEIVGLYEDEESDLDPILEAKGDSSGSESKATMGDVTGKLHELLVGYHLNGGKHMEVHKDSTGLSPEEAHAKHVELLRKKDPENFEKNYKTLHDRAKSAADDIRKHVEAGGRKVTKVHWTSTGSAVAKSTGIEGQSGKNNPSDIIIHAHKEGDDPKTTKPKFVGVSLKKTEKNSPETTSANLGASSLHPKASEDLSALKAKRAAKYKSMPSSHIHRNSVEKSEWLAKRPKTAKNIEVENKKFVTNTAKATVKHLNSLSQEELHNRVKTLLSAHHNDMHGMPVGDGSGHSHELIKHTTYGDKNGEVKHQLISDVPKHYEHLFNDPKHKIKAVHRGDGTINYTHKGKPIISQTVRLADNSHIMPMLKSVASPLVGASKPANKPKQKAVSESVRLVLDLIKSKTE